jgi:hypothetical protein
LGVLCELAAEERVIEGAGPYKDYQDNIYDESSLAYNNSIAYPSHTVSEWAGTPFHIVSMLNDASKYDFNKIADYIKENL